MKDKEKFGYDSNETYWDEAQGKSVTGREANTLLEAAPTPEMEALILLTIVPKRLHIEKSDRKRRGRRR